MNERIKELAEQARLLTGWPVGQVEYQKFAELIIWECINETGNCAGTGDMIKEHFGIKE